MTGTPQPDGTADQHAGHLVLMYGRDRSPLIRGVGDYLAEGLRRGERTIVIATAEHGAAFVEQLEMLGAGPRTAIADGRLVIADAHQTLARFMVAGQPDWVSFEQTIGGMLGALRASEAARVRAYGEMVGVLWEAGCFTAAIALEEFWNRLLFGSGIDLFCAYPIDVCGDAFTSADVQAVMCAHTRLLPSESALEPALERAMNDVLGPVAAGVRTLIESDVHPSWAAMPRAEATILWLRDNLPAHSDAILARARKYTELAA